MMFFVTKYWKKIHKMSLKSKNGLFFAKDSLNPSQNINWTASYRSDSVLTAPYERFTLFKNFTQLPVKAPRNYAFSKTKKVAWFVSNCYAANGRSNYAKELSKYIGESIEMFLQVLKFSTVTTEVDIFGGCGDKECSKENEECFEMLKKSYKFYLSFENSNCREYITEKFFVNALRYQ